MRWYDNTQIFQLLLHKRGTFTYSDSNPGDSRNQKMWRCCSQIASDYMKLCINPLRLVSVPPPPPPPPDTSPAPSFSGSVAYRHPCSLLHVVYRGVPKQLPLTKVPVWRVPRFNTLGPHPLTVTLGRSFYITISRLSGLFITCNKPGIKPY